VCIDRDQNLVVKRFRSSARGEPAREWAALKLLDDFAPGLAPVPVRGDLDGDPPAIVMSWLPGAQLGTIAPLSGAQTDGWRWRLSGSGGRCHPPGPVPAWVRP